MRERWSSSWTLLPLRIAPQPYCPSRRPLPPPRLPSFRALVAPPRRHEKMISTGFSMAAPAKMARNVAVKASAAIPSSVSVPLPMPGTHALCGQPAELPSDVWTLREIPGCVPETARGHNKFLVYECRRPPRVARSPRNQRIELVPLGTAKERVSQRFPRQSRGNSPLIPRLVYRGTTERRPRSGVRAQRPPAAPFPELPRAPGQGNRPAGPRPPSPPCPPGPARCIPPRRRHGGGD